jgi:hypothetical protein
MELLGKAKDDFILKVTEQEFAQLAGFESWWSCARELRIEKEKLKPGQKFNIGSQYKKACEALSLHEDALKAANQLKRTSSAFLGFFKAKEQNGN